MSGVSEMKGFLTNGDKFLELYRQLEREGRRVYFPEAADNENIIGRLMNVPQLKMYKDDIDYCRVVRNFLVHTPKVNGGYAIVPSDELVDFLQRCVDRIKNPIKAMDYAVKINNMYTAGLSSRVIDIIRHMRINGFTHVPIMEDNRLIGVFSANVLFGYLADASFNDIDLGATIEQLASHIAINNHTNEYFVFMPKDSTLHEVSRRFKIDTRTMKQLCAVFLTESGKSDERVLGMITPYSLLRDAPEF
jgi:predicted transcriptional regulator